MEDQTSESRTWIFVGTPEEERATRRREYELVERLEERRG